MGGFVPLGYNHMKQQLVINSVAAEVGRSIFRLYLDLKSVCLIQIAAF